MSTNDLFKSTTRTWNIRSSGLSPALVALACLTAVSCGGTTKTDPAEAIVAQAYGHSNPESLDEVVTQSDFVAVVEVTATRNPTVDDIEPPEPGVTPASVHPEEFKTGRILTYKVSSVLWSKTDASIPAEMDVVAMGFHDNGTELVPIVPAEGVRAEAGGKYVAAFVEYADGMYALAGFGFQYPIDESGDKVDASQESPHGPAEFTQLSLPDLAKALESATPLQLPESRQVSVDGREVSGNSIP